MVAFETLHHMKNKKARKSGFMIMKLDMSKAYNQVEWDSLCLLMKKMGFHKRWINLIFGCISSVSYSILVNGEPQVDIKPSRGIRQRDPLSLYLFLLCSEGLNGLIQKHVATCDIRGFSLCRDSPQISHLFFAGDTLLFCQAELREVQVIKMLLGEYELAFGQKINIEKTNIFFGKSVCTSSKAAIKTFLKILDLKEYEKYLALLEN